MTKLRIGVSGARRARSFMPGLRAYGESVGIVVVYEPDPAERESIAHASRSAGITHTGLSRHSWAHASGASRPGSVPIPESNRRGFWTDTQAPFW